MKNIFLIKEVQIKDKDWNNGMKFRTKVVVCMISILSIIFGAGSSALILNSFNSALDREKKSAIQSYEMILNTLWCRSVG